MSEDSSMMGNWDEDFNAESKSKKSEGSEKTKIEYVDLSKPGNYRIRLVGPHVRFRKHFKPFKAVVQDNDDGKNGDPAWKAGFVPGRRFAINVINKTGLKEGETGKIEILERGPTVFKSFSAYKQATGIDPAGKSGPDFILTVKIPEVKGKLIKKDTEYSVIPLEPAPFTEAEVAMLNKKTGGQGLWALKDIYKPFSEEKLQALWDELPDDQKIAPPKPWEKEDKQKPTSQVPVKKEEKIIDEIAEKNIDEELFNNNEDDSDPANLF